MFEIEYTKKPSVTTLRAAIRKAVKNGNTFIRITWGENQITIERNGMFGKWFGSGWIGRNGGFDLANDINWHMNELKNPYFGDINAQLSKLTIRK
jgi:hypothetical protein